MCIKFWILSHAERKGCSVKSLKKCLKLCSTSATPELLFVSGMDHPGLPWDCNCGQSFRNLLAATYTRQGEETVPRKTSSRLKIYPHSLKVGNIPYIFLLKQISNRWFALKNFYENVTGVRIYCSLTWKTLPSLTLGAQFFLIWGVPPRWGLFLGLTKSMMK